LPFSLSGVPGGPSSVPGDPSSVPSGDPSSVPGGVPGDPSSVPSGGQLFITCIATNISSRDGNAVSRTVIIRALRLEELQNVLGAIARE